METGVFNGGYEIIQTLQISEATLVIGHNKNIPEDGRATPYVTWETDKDKKDFYWGHYFKDRYSAERDLVMRGMEKMRFYDRVTGYSKQQMERDER